jgi:hypothetical protein
MGSGPIMQYFMAAIEWRSIQTFVLGMLTGFVLLGLFIALLLILSRKSKERTRLSKSESIADEVIRKMIESKQEELESTVKFADNAYFRVAFDLSFDLMQEIAKHYYPESKYPIYELSVQELLNLNFYITQRLQSIIDRKVVRLFKNARISTVVDILNKKKAFDNSKLMKATRNLKINKFLSYGSMALNYANPIYWFRKLAMKPTTDLVTKEICNMIISIVGEETNKVYSKKLFQKPDNVELLETALETTFNQLAEEAGDGNGTQKAS